MAFVATVTPQFIEPIIDNLLTVIARDFAEASVLVTGNGALTPFAQSCRSRRVDVRYPFLGCYPVRTGLVNQDEDQSANEKHEVKIELALVGSDSEALTSELLKYVRAVDWIVRHASEADMSENLSANGATDPIWTISAHEYTLIQRNALQQYLQQAQITVLVEVTEQ
jgi:hypothetical protein